MSDFFNSGWSLFVAGVTVAGLIFCLVVLAVASKRKVMANDNTTGHVWDEDLRELNNPLPRWWLGLFIITVVFAAIYLALYPGLGSHAGQLKWSSAGQHQAEMDKARAQMAPVYAKFVGQPAEVLAKDPQAMAIGERLFANNCAQCHGADARGSKGFPNLTDADWLYGGSHDKIKETIVAGRAGNMPPMAAALGTAEDVKNVAHYVLSLSGSPHNSVAAQLGKPKFGACAACHGADGKGNQALGAPNLTDKVWLHGWGEQAIVNIVTNGKTNQMPAQAQRLSPEQVHVLGAYVWGLSQTATVAAAK
ncbi:MAG: cytochrome-c oxidase, cbb3-type subunit III [Rubrivivax sp.]